MPDLNALYRQYRDRAAFYIVYIQEAHPIDAWHVPVNEKDNVLIPDPASGEERARVAGRCVKDLGIEFPALVDGAGNEVERAYTGWPDRLYVIGTDGRIALKSDPGPFGFEPRAVGETLERLIPLPPTMDRS